MAVAKIVIERADKQKRFAEVSKLLVDQAKRQEGDELHDLQPLLQELALLANDIRGLTVQINSANVVNGNMERIAERDSLDRHIKALSAIADAAMPRPGFRTGASELRWVANVDIQALLARRDSLAKQRRELNVTIQETDWK